ncbi:hypothetical protein PybrP1_000630 [[Pythium] brassicae (nom. inval.)]|nr:hypothetical protein PybrP1_000630 [[Pythium] brassicae (nom. inval.)]
MRKWLDPGADPRFACWRGHNNSRAGPVSGEQDEGFPLSSVASDVVCTAVVPADGPSVHFESWILAIGAHVVDVPGNGNRLSGAFYASTLGHCEYDTLLPYTPNVAVGSTWATPSGAVVATGGATPLAWRLGRGDRRRPAAGRPGVPLRYGGLNRGDGIGGAQSLRRAAELLAAAPYLRELIYVVYVLEGGQALAQCHAFRDEQRPQGDAVTVGFESPMSMALFNELVVNCLEAKTLPKILVLRHRGGGYHYQGQQLREGLHAECFLGGDSSDGTGTRLHSIQVKLVLVTTTAEMAYDIDPPAAAVNDVQPLQSVGGEATGKARNRAAKQPGPRNRGRPLAVVFAIEDELVYRRLLQIAEVDRDTTAADRRK